MKGALRTGECWCVCVCLCWHRQGLGGARAQRIDGPRIRRRAGRHLHRSFDAELAVCAQPRAGLPPVIWDL